MMFNSKNKTVLIFLSLLFLIIGVGIFYNTRPSDSTDTTILKEGWSVLNDVTNNITFQYPKSISAKYTTLADWPPKVQVVNSSFVCDPSGEENSRAGKTEQVTSGMNRYCVTKVVEGAAGSVYTQYAFAKEVDGKTVILTFSTKSTQCGNYDEIKKQECEMERNSFNINSTLEEIFDTLKFIK